MTGIKIFALFRRGLRWLWRGLAYTVLFALMLVLLQRSTYPTYIQFNSVADMVSEHQFDYIGWEVEALLAKTGQTLWGNHASMSEAERSQFVRDYMADLNRARQLEAEVAAIYTDPTISDADAASADVRAERDDLRADLRRRQSTAEAILEGQVAAVLVDKGFGTFGQLLPPISMRFTRVPNLLIVSPRDEIRFDISINLDPMPIDEIAALEERIAQRHDVSALVVPLGGIALYPAMILETTSIPWAVETFAHEWLHHYLFFFPLGLSYFDGETFAGEARIINETVADTFGKAIAPEVLARYYPELMANMSSPQTPHPDATLTQNEPPTFDFGAAMNETRVNVDRYMVAADVVERMAAVLPLLRIDSTLRDLSQDIITTMERYMEARRVLFYENGYRIRKLNQAYFAFYGGYQAGDIPGVGGQDPIGPAVAEIRQLSADIHSFVVHLRGVTTRDELLALRDRLRGESASRTEVASTY